MDNALDRSVTVKWLLRYSLPTIISMFFMNVYFMTDGIFVARLINTSALSAVNIVAPMLLVSIALGTMLATGGSAIVAKKMGEGKTEEARRNFSLLAVVTLAGGIVLSGIGLLFIEPIIRFLGANEAIYQYCYDYTYVTLLLFPTGMVAMLFEVFFITAGRAGLGMAITMIGGVVTVSLDYICIALLDMGIAGAAVSTGVGYGVPGVIGFCYFLFNRKGTLYLVRPQIDWAAIGKSCTNGASEMVTNLSYGVITLLFNNILIRMAGEDGVASITIILYVMGLLSSLFMGYSIGIAPIISFNYGKQDHDRMKRIYSVSTRFILITSIFTFSLSLLFAGPLVGVFSPVETPVYDMALHGFRLFSFCFLFMGFSIFGSAMFTALSNGKVSAIISFLRTFVFTVAAVLLLPVFFALDGVWLSIPLAQMLGVLVTFYYFRKLKDTYHYA